MNEPDEQVAPWHALLCEHGVDLDEQRCEVCEGREDDERDEPPDSFATLGLSQADFL